MSAALVGVDIGGTKILAVTVDPSDPARTRNEHRVATPAGAGALVDAVVDAVRAVRGPEAREAIGVGVPGLVDRTGRLAFGPNLSRLSDVPIGRLLRERLGTAVVVDNDAACAAWGEFRVGRAAHADDVLLLTLGTGIGAGIVRDGVLHRGANGFAAEPGHMVIDPRGPLCTCGRRGCWERMGSGSALGRLSREAAHAGRLDAVVAEAGGDPEAVRGEHVVAAARSGDEQADRVLAEFGWWVALGLANLINYEDPGLIVLGGGVMEAADVLIDRIREPVPALVHGGAHRPAVPIEVAALGERAGAVGAALLSGDATAADSPGA